MVEISIPSAGGMQSMTALPLSKQERCPVLPACMVVMTMQMTGDDPAGATPESRGVREMVTPSAGSIGKVSSTSPSLRLAARLRWPPPYGGRRCQADSRGFSLRLRPALAFATAQIRISLPHGRRLQNAGALDWRGAVPKGNAVLHLRDGLGTMY